VITSGLLVAGSLVAISLVAGAVVGASLHVTPRLSALVASFGGGILFAAVALELVPEADESAGTAWTVVGLLAGAALYVAADGWLTRDKHTEAVRRSGHAAAAGQEMKMPPPNADASRGEAIAAGIVVDGIPESFALGLIVASGEPGIALLVAVVVGNVTEAYGAAQPILAGGKTRRFAIGLLTGIGVVLAAATVFGATVGDDAPLLIGGTAQALAAGAVIAVLSISIVPYAFEDANRAVALATTLGFTAGYVLS
jgi:zinc transporter, ZIP family